MKDQHTKIKGYRDLSQEEIDLMNDVKGLGSQIEAVIQKVQSHLLKQSLEVKYWSGQVTDMDKQQTANEEANRIGAAEPGRWANIARTDFQTALMALTRAVAQPGSF